MIKYKITKDLKDKIPEEVINTVIKLVDSIIENKLVGNFRNETPVDRKEIIWIMVSPQKNGGRVHTAFLDEDKEFRGFWLPYEGIGVEKHITIGCSFAKTYNLLNIG